MGSASAGRAPGHWRDGTDPSVRLERTHTPGASHRTRGRRWRDQQGGGRGTLSSVKTVEYHLTKVMKSSDARSRTHLARLLHEAADQSPT